MNIFSIVEPRTQREELKAVIGKETFRVIKDLE
jgi:hypothetical protein